MTQVPILTVTLNPALDISTGADEVVPDVKLRCDAPVTDPGGGGINVSRAIAVMGGRSTALVALGGATGQRIADLLGKAALPVLRIEAPGETRASMAVSDRARGGQYRFVLPGPEWPPRRVVEALHQIGSAAGDGWVVLSGSNPPGVPPSFAAMLAARLAAQGAADLLVDTSGAALSEVAGAGLGLSVLRMDGEEAEGLAGRALPTGADSAGFAASLVRSGAARAVIVARGADGSVLATADGAWHAQAAHVPVVSKVGAGDSFVAGFTLAIARGQSLPDALGVGAAAASAAVMTPATELCRAEDVQRLIAECPVVRL